MMQVFFGVHVYCLGIFFIFYNLPTINANGRAALNCHFKWKKMILMANESHVCMFGLSNDRAADDDMH